MCVGLYRYITKVCAFCSIMKVLLEELIVQTVTSKNKDKDKDVKVLLRR